MHAWNNFLRTNRHVTPLFWGFESWQTHFWPWNYKYTWLRACSCIHASHILKHVTKSVPLTWFLIQNYDSLCDLCEWPLFHYFWLKLTTKQWIFNEFMSCLLDHLVRLELGCPVIFYMVISWLFLVEDKTVWMNPSHALATLWRPGFHQIVATRWGWTLKIN